MGGERNTHTTTQIKMSVVTISIKLYTQQKQLDTVLRLCHGQRTLRNTSSASKHRSHDTHDSKKSFCKQANPYETGRHTSITKRAAFKYQKPTDSGCAHVRNCLAKSRNASREMGTAKRRDMMCTTKPWRTAHAENCQRIRPQGQTHQWRHNTHLTR